MKLTKKERELIIDKAIRLIKLYAILPSHDPIESCKAAYIMMLSEPVPKAQIDLMHFEAMTQAYIEINKELKEEIKLKIQNQELFKDIFQPSKYN